MILLQHRCSHGILFLALPVLQRVREIQSEPQMQLTANMDTDKNIMELKSRLMDLQTHSTEAEGTSSKAVNMMDDMEDNLMVSIQVRRRRDKMHI